MYAIYWALIVIRFKPCSDPVKKRSCSHLTSEELNHKEMGSFATGQRVNKGRNGMWTRVSLTWKAGFYPSSPAASAVNILWTWPESLLFPQDGLLDSLYTPTIPFPQGLCIWLIMKWSQKQSEISPDLLPPSHLRGLFEAAEALPCPLHPGQSPNLRAWNLTSSSFGIVTLLIFDLIIGSPPLD